MSQLEKKALSVLVCLMVSLIFVGCGPSQNDLDAQATKIAAEIFATQTAEAVKAITLTPNLLPTPTPMLIAATTQTLIPPTQTPALPTNTPTPSATHTPSPTPTPSGPGLIVDGWRIMPIGTILEDPNYGKQPVTVHLAFENLGDGISKTPPEAWRNARKQFKLITSEGYDYEAGATITGGYPLPPGFIYVGARIPMGSWDMNGLAASPAVGTGGYKIQTPFGLLDTAPVEVKIPTSLPDENFLNQGDSFDIGDVRVTAIDISRLDSTSISVLWRLENTNQGYNRNVSFNYYSIGDGGIMDPSGRWGGPYVGAFIGPGQSEDRDIPLRVFAGEGNIKLILWGFKYEAEGQPAVSSLGPDSFVIFNVSDGDSDVSAATAPADTVADTSTVSKPALDWVDIPAGDFVMGSSNNDLEETLIECNESEGKATGQSCQTGWFHEPQRTIFVNDFEITKYEITNSQYEACVAAGICNEANTKIENTIPAYDEGYFSSDYPVVRVNWNDANAFCQWVNGRLPTEDEWEKAARGTDGRRYPWGNAFSSSKANLGSTYPASVGSFPEGASPYGVMDMAGNVFEWTATWDGEGYVLRGGSWNNYYFRGRVTDRGTQLEPNFANYDIGFRCARGG